MSLRSSELGDVLLLAGGLLFTGSQLRGRQVEDGAKGSVTTFMIADVNMRPARASQLPTFGYSDTEY